MDEHESMWDSLGLTSLVPISTTSPPASPSPSPANSSEPSWWNRRTASPVLQVRLDGEPADSNDLAPSSLDTLLPLSVASGRIEKPRSKSPYRPHSSHFLPTSPTLSHIHSPSHSIKPEPSPLPLHAPLSTSLSTSPHTPSPAHPPPPPVSIPLATKPPPQAAPPRALLSHHTSPTSLSRVAHRPNSASATTAITTTPPSHTLSAPTAAASPTTTLPATRAVAVPAASSASPQTTTPVTSPHIPSPASAPARTLPVSSGTSAPSQLRSLSTTPSHPSTLSPVQAKTPQRPSAPNPSSSAPSESTSASLKEKREREARQFPKEVLTNLDGTTSAEVRKMNATERELVLYKRKLRNRESARRSRQKRQATLGELQEEIDDLMQLSGRMVEVGLTLREENSRLHERLTCALAELKGLRGMYPNEHGTPRNDAGSSQAAAMKMKLGG